METMRIDETRCKRDGLCALACSVGLVRILEKGGLPTFAPGRRNDCIRCGHCLAVCPAGAIALPWLTEPPTPFDGKTAADFEAAAALMKSRRSMRRFRPEPPSREELERLFDVARHAPSGHNGQAVEWIVVGAPEAVRGVGDLVVEWMRDEAERGAERAATLNLAAVARAWERGRDFVVRGAPCLVLAHAPRQGATPMEDAIISTAWLELAAHAAGLGACWAGLVVAAAQDWPPLRARLGLGDDRQVWGALMLGRPALRYRAVPARPAPRVSWIE